MTDVFTKFDHLGSALSKLSFDCVTLSALRLSNGDLFYSVNLHPGPGVCVIAHGDTPSKALETALHNHAARERMLVEIASEQVAA